MGLGLAHLHLTSQMRCLRFRQSQNPPLKTSPFACLLLLFVIRLGFGPFAFDRSDAMLALIGIFQFFR